MKKKKCIILLHGWGANVSKFKQLSDDLKRSGWEVITPQLPGFDAPEPDVGWSLDDYVGYIENTINKKNPDCGYVVFGHSFGGRLAIKMAIKTKNTVGIVLCATSGISRGNSFKRTIFGFAAKAGKILLVNPKAAGVFKKVLYKAAQEHDYEKTTGVMKETFRNIITEDLKPIAEKIKKHTLILWGDADKMTPVADAHYLNKHIKNSKLVVYEKVGHKLPYNKPSEVAGEIDLWYQNLK